MNRHYNLAKFVSKILRSMDLANRKPQKETYPVMVLGDKGFGNRSEVELNDWFR